MEKTQQMTGYRYSNRPAEDYVYTQDGRQIGPGVDPRLRGDLGAWNLYWLSYPNLEAHTDLGSGAGPILTDPVADAAVATAIQRVNGVCVGDLARSLGPRALIQALRSGPVDHLELCEIYGRPNLWFAVMDSRADFFTKSRGPVYDLTAQADGTNRVTSATIIPLTRLMARSVH